MAKIIIQTDGPADQDADVTLSERVVAANLESVHYTTQLIERVTWATADAEAIEHPVGAGQAEQPAMPTPAAGRRWSLVASPGRRPAPSAPLSAWPRSGQR